MTMGQHEDDEDGGFRWVERDGTGVEEGLEWWGEIGDMMAGIDGRSGSGWTIGRTGRRA